MKNTKIKGLSKKEVEIISWLEFYEKYFFSSKDIEKFFKNKTQRYNTIKSLTGKKRIIKLNKNKYYLVPIKAKTGLWIENPFIIADEIFNAENYFIGSWAAANYWKLTNQIPMQLDIYTTKRQGKTKIFNTRFIFHRTTANKLNKAVTKKIQSHTFKILNKKDTEKWLKSKS